ncbi:MAG: amidohydrolase [Cyclobacteriaceae bacterium]|nr:MAG: amidohydrolase [Cyclobacteriaceae bacterium]
MPACILDTGIPIIDTHQHLWDLDLIPLSWVSPPLDRSFITEDYLEAVKGQNVTKSIYMEVGAPAEYRDKETEWALELCKNPDNPTVGAVIAADPTAREFQSYMGKMAGNPYLKGIRYSFRTSEELLLPQVIGSIRFLGKIGLSFDLNLKPELLNIGGQLLDACPETRFVLNHCGNADPVAFLAEHDAVPRDSHHDADQWYRNIELLAQRDNVICKISGLVDNVPDYPLNASNLAPIINHCFEAFGSDRLLFAGDWPVCLRNMPLALWIETLKQVVASRSLVDQRKLFHDNAYSFYGLTD